MTHDLKSKRKKHNVTFDHPCVPVVLQQVHRKTAKISSKLYCASFVNRPTVRVGQFVTQALPQVAELYYCTCPYVLQISRRCT